MLSLLYIYIYRRNGGGGQSKHWNVSHSVARQCEVATDTSIKYVVPTVRIHRTLEPERSR